MRLTRNGPWLTFWGAFAALATAGCGPVTPRPVAPVALCGGGDHEVVLWDGGVGVCPDDPTSFSNDPVSNFRRLHRDAGVDR